MNGSFKSERELHDMIFGFLMGYQLDPGWSWTKNHFFECNLQYLVSVGYCPPSTYSNHPLRAIYEKTLIDQLEPDIIIAYEINNKVLFDIIELKLGILTAKHLCQVAKYKPSLEITLQNYMISKQLFI